MKTICKIAIVVLAGLHLIKAVATINATMAIFVVSIVVLLSGLVIMSKGFKKATIVFLAIGTAMLFQSSQPLSVWILAVNAMTNIIAVLVIMQTFSIPIKMGEYNIAIGYWLHKYFKKEGTLFLFTTISTHIFTSFLMFGSIPLMFSLMENTLKGHVGDYKRFMATAISRGFAFASLWAPGAITVLLMVQTVGVTWSEIFVPGIILSIIGFVISYLIEMKFNLSVNTKYNEIDNKVLYSEKCDQGRAFHIIWVVLSLILFNIILEKLHIGSSSNRITLAVAIVVLLWTLQFIKNPNLKTTLRNYWKNDVLKTADLAPFFIAMGIFFIGLEHSSFIGVIQFSLQNFTNTWGLLSIVIIPLLIIVCSIFGIHPFITIVLFGKIFTLLQLPITPVTIALCLALGGTISYMVSPFAGIIMIIAKFLDARTVDVAIHWNWLFSLIYFWVGIIFAYFWGQF